MTYKSAGKLAGRLREIRWEVNGKDFGRKGVSVNSEGAFGAAHGGKPLAFRQNPFLFFLRLSLRNFYSGLTGKPPAYRYVLRQSRWKEISLAH